MMCEIWCSYVLYKEIRVKDTITVTDLLNCQKSPNKGFRNALSSLFYAVKGLVDARYSLEADGEQVLSYEAHDLLVRLGHAQAGGQLAVARRVAVEVQRRRAVGLRRLVHGGCGGLRLRRRQPAGAFARRPMACALVARVSGGQAGPRGSPSAPRAQRARRIGRARASASE